MRHVLTPLALALALSLPVGAQDRKSLDEAATKALEYIKSTKSKSWARFAENVFCGLAYMAEGSTLGAGTYSSELNACLDACMGDGGGGGQENWYLALVALFLSEVYKKEQADHIKARLEKLVKRIEEVQEPTGGWSHTKGFAYNLRNKKVGDLGIVTGLMIAALGNVKGCKIEVPGSVLERAYAYCNKLSDGAGLIYGTGNPVPDFACSRGAGVAIGLHFMNNRNDLYSRVARGVRDRMKQIEQGHAFPPVHFFDSAVGCYVTGVFAEWKAEWLGRILAQREQDGSIWFKNHERIDYEKNQLQSNVIGTAIMAIILNLEKKNVFQPFKPKPKDGPAAPGQSPKPEQPKSPFSRKDDPKPSEPPRTPGSNK